MFLVFFFFKQKTAYEMRISDWSSDVCSSDLGDLTDSANLTRIMQQVQPDEVYNLGAQRHVAVSFESPEYTADVDAMGTMRLLEAIRLLGMGDKPRFSHASTSELYGLVQTLPQREPTPFSPRSPYAVPNHHAHRTT